MTTTPITAKVLDIDQLASLAQDLKAAQEAFAKFSFMQPLEWPEHGLCSLEEAAAIARMREVEVQAHEAGRAAEKAVPWEPPVLSPKHQAALDAHNAAYHRHSQMENVILRALGGIARNSNSELKRMTDSNRLALKIEQALRQSREFKLAQIAKEQTAKALSYYTRSKSPGEVARNAAYDAHAQAERRANKDAQEAYLAQHQAEIDAGDEAIRAAQRRVRERQEPLGQRIRELIDQMASLVLPEEATP